MLSADRSRWIVRVISAAAVIHGAYFLYIGVLEFERITHGANVPHLQLATRGLVEIAGGIALFFDRRWSRWLFLAIAAIALLAALALCQVWFLIADNLPEATRNRLAGALAFALLWAGVSTLSAVLVFRHFKLPPKSG